MRKPILAISAVVILGLLAFWFLKPRTLLEKVESSKGSILFAKGTYLFDFEMQTIGSLDMASIAKSQGSAELANKKQEITSILKAQLELIATRDELLMHFIKPEITMQSQALDASTFGINEAFVLVNMDERGRFQSLSFPKMNNSFSKDIWLKVFSQIQAIKPGPNDKASTWEATEQDHQGNYRSRYEVDAHSIRKKKFEALVKPEAAGDSFKIDEGQDWMASFKDGRIDSFQSKDGLSFQSQSKASFHNQVSLKLQLLKFWNNAPVLDEAQRADLVRFE
jgi:hypothetical protein